MTQIPRPRRKLLRTWLKRPRPVRLFAKRINLLEVLSPRPENDELAHWGEYILLEDIIVALHRDGTTTWHTHLISMPYRDESLAMWDHVHHPYMLKKTRLQVPRAVVYTPDGDIYRAHAKTLQVAPQARILKLSFAPLRPGVIVEYEMQDDQFIPSSQLPGIITSFIQRGNVPCRRRRLTVAIAEPYTETAQIHVYHEGAEPTRFDLQGYEVAQWDLHEVAGIEFDQWTPPLRDFAPWIDVSTVPDWEPVVKHYRAELLPPSPPSQQIANLAHELLAKRGDPATMSPREKMLAVYEYVTRDIRYGRHPSELVNRRVRQATQMLQDMRGDCKDKSALMVSLLESLQLPAQVVVILTATNGCLPFLPSMRFDHAIVRAQLDGEQIWFDPAAGHYSFGDYPQNDQGVLGLVLEHDRWEEIITPLYAPEQTQTVRNSQGEIRENGDFDYRTQLTARGELAAYMRSQLYQRNDEHQRNLISLCELAAGASAVVSDVDINNLEQLDQPVRIAYRVQIERRARAIRDLFIFRVPWAGGLDRAGAVSARSRTEPLRMPHSWDNVECFTLRLPTGFTGYGLPIQESWKCDALSYELQIRMESDLLICERHVRVEGRLVPPDQYPAFKQICDNCARSDSQDIVLMRSVPDSSGPFHGPRTNSGYQSLAPSRSEADSSGPFHGPSMNRGEATKLPDGGSTTSEIVMGRLVDRD